METKIMAAIASGFWASISLVGHSNGGVLVLLVARELIKRGYVIEDILLFAPAVQSKVISREFSQWMEEGKLKRAVLVMATKDRTLGLVARLKLLTWPWGSLGVQGWDFEEIPEHLRDSFGEVRLAVGHTEFLEPLNRRETFETYLAPLWGFQPLKEVAA